MQRVLITTTLILLSGSPLGGQGQGSFDHSLFNDLLRAHVTQSGMVDYDGFAGSPTFQQYLRALATARPEGLPPQERLALWINAYNAYTIELINRHDERESIRNINKTLGLFGGKGPWKERLAEVGGKLWTLDEIEHQVIRERFSEPRIHFALVCAALGCPPLRTEAYVGERLEEQLQDQTREFLADTPEKNRVDIEAGVVYLSPIFDWYEEDFPKGSKALGGFLAPFHPPGPIRDFLLGGTFEVRSTDYDWSLNIRPPA